MAGFSEYGDILARRKVNRTLVDQVVSGFLAMDDAGRLQAAEKLNRHFEQLAPSLHIRWTLSFTAPAAQNARHPDHDDDPVNLLGSGPVPIVPRDDDPHDAAPTAHPAHGDHLEA